MCHFGLVESNSCHTLVSSIGLRYADSIVKAHKRLLRQYWHTNLFQNGHKLQIFLIFQILKVMRRNNFL